MNSDQWTEKAREAIAAAQQLAEQHRNSQLEPEHLLLALVEQHDGVVPRILERLQADPREVAQELERAIAALLTLGTAPTQLAVSPRLRRVLDRAQEEMRQLKDDYLSTEHLLLAMAEAPLGGAIARLLR